ncbi:MAG: class II aldolase/adducin family protein [Pseudomonadota bacterium]
MAPDPRREIIRTACALSEKGLSPGMSGNVSARCDGGFLITPSATPYDQLSGDDIVMIGGDGQAAAGQRKPSSETPFHHAIYETFAEAAAVVHCHSPKATALACLRKPIPAFHYMVAVAGGRKIPLAGYHTPGTEALALDLVNTLEGHRACLMANHGLIAHGPSLRDALSLTEEIETLASMYLDALAAGEPHILNDQEMEEILQMFKGYRPG